MNKIIRELCRIDLRGINSCDINNIVLSRIAETKRCAEALAYKLNYPLNSRRFETFDVDYRYSQFDRITPQKSETNAQEMISESIRTGLPALYSYVIDGETDLNGMKIID